MVRRADNAAEVYFSDVLIGWIPKVPGKSLLSFPAKPHYTLSWVDGPDPSGAMTTHCMMFRVDRRRFSISQAQAAVAGQEETARKIRAMTPGYCEDSTDQLARVLLFDWPVLAVDSIGQYELLFDLPLFEPNDHGGVDLSQRFDPDEFLSSTISDAALKVGTITL